MILKLLIKDYIYKLTEIRWFLIGPNTLFPKILVFKYLQNIINVIFIKSECFKID